jgi:hypothetical protein
VPSVVRCKLLKSWVFENDREFEEKLEEIANKSTSPIEVHFETISTREFPVYAVLVFYTEEVP